MARRPFSSLLAVAALALLLVLALLAQAFPAPLAAVADRCARSGGLCRSLMSTGRMLGGPLLLAMLPWSLCLGAGEAWRQWKATRRALAALRAHDAAPCGALHDLCADLGLTGRVTVIAAGAPLALCCGLLRPRILISGEALARLRPNELSAVLRHERVHLRHRHPLQLLIARALAAALPFLPLLRELAEALPRSQELAADRAVIHAGERHALGRALLALLADQADAPRVPLAVGMVGVLDARIDQLTGAATPVHSISRRALLLTGLVFAAALIALTLSVLPLSPGPVGPAGSPALALARLSLPWHCLMISTVFALGMQALRTGVVRARR